MKPWWLSALGALGTLAACGEPVVEMTLQLPSAGVAEAFDLSCIDAVEVYVNGKDRGGQDEPPDNTIGCVDLTGPHATFADVRDAIAGRFDVALPRSGLLGVEVRASTGSCSSKQGGPPGDAIFYGGALHEGGDRLTIPVVPAQSCAPRTTGDVIRPIDLLALARDGVAACATPILDDIGAGADVATLHPTLVDGVVFDPGSDGAALRGGTLTLPLLTQTGPDTCVALGYGEDNSSMTTASCIRRGPGVCTTTNQIELPIIDGNIAFDSADRELIDEFGGWVVGAVWGVDAAGTKAPVAGARVAVADPAKAGDAQIVYASYPAGSPNVVPLPGATVTDASGLFFIYVSVPTDFVISAPTFNNQAVRIGSPDEPSTSLVLLSKMR